MFLVSSHSKNYGQLLAIYIRKAVCIDPYFFLVWAKVTKWAIFLAGFHININTAIQAYNSRLGATPAGGALITAQIITLGQLSALRGVEQALQAAPPGQQGLSWLRSTDINLGWDYKLRERFVITPNVAVFNVFNFANFDGANNPLSPILNTAGNANPGSLNSTTYHQRSADRIGLGSGVFSLGAPRVIEFGVKVSF